MFIAIRAKRVLGILCLTIFAIGSILAGSRTLVYVFSPQQQSAACYIIDAGHGGEDGGAVAQDGTIESGLNLAIAQKLTQILRFTGQEADMTRQDENAVYSSGATTLREKKRSDLKNRVTKINNTPNALLISIHQNSLPTSPRIHGAQVFYNHVEGAEPLAQQVQKQLNETINSGNEKEIRQMDSSIYLMRQVECSAILVECGFLSNPEETQRLKESAYQTKLAATIAAGILNHTNGVSTHESE